MSFVNKIIDRCFRGAIAERQRVTLSLLELEPEARLLDCGCGDGELTMKVAEKIGTKHIYGIDVNDADSAKARAMGIDVHSCDLNQKLLIGDESCDVIYASEVIEHLHNTDLFLKECHRILKKGGYLLIETPNLAAFHNIVFLLFGKQPPPATVSDEIFAGAWGAKERHIKMEGPGHCRIFTLGALVELLEYHGFKVENKAGSVYYPWPNPLTRLMCAIDKSHAAYIIAKARKIN